MKKALVTFLVLIPSLMSPAAHAAADGSSPLVCALSLLLECSRESGCQSRTVESVNLPHFLRIDLRGKTMSAAGNPQDRRTTPVKNVEQTAGRIILQGAENGRGWNINLDQETGKFTAAISEEQNGFIVFGACISN